MNTNVVLKKISKIYNINNVESKKTVLRNINLELKESKVYGLIGSNGSGKSTLLKVISQIIPQTSGSLKVKGSAEYLSLDFIMGQMNLSITAKESLLLTCKMKNLKKRATETKIKEIECFLDIGDYFNKQIRTFSTGMKARLAFASKFFFLDSDILLIDELLSVGDFKFLEKCSSIFLKFIKKPKIVLIVSHEPLFLKKICDEFILIEKGEIVFSGSSDKAIKEYKKLILEKRYKQIKIPNSSSELYSLDIIQDGISKISFENYKFNDISLFVKFKKKLLNNFNYKLSIFLKKYNGRILTKLNYKFKNEVKCIEFNFKKLELAENIYFFEVCLFKNNINISKKLKYFYFFNTTITGGEPLFYYNPAFRLKRLKNE